MSPVESAGRFPLGATVRVKPGTSESICDLDIPIGGWVGVIREADPHSSLPSYRVEFSQTTLDQIPHTALKRWARQFARYRSSISILRKLWVRDYLLELDTGEPIVTDQPVTEEGSRPLDSDDEGDWIRGHLGLTSATSLYSEGELSINDFQKYFRVITQNPSQEVLSAMFPAIAAWIQRHGKIEISCLRGASVAAKLTDANNVLLEETESKTLAEALNGLEDTIALHIQTNSTLKIV